MKSIYATILGPSDGGAGPPYLPRALALTASLMRHNRTAEFAFFCIDPQAARILESLALPRCRVYRESEFAGATLLSLRGKRPISEYCWTAKSFALEHLLTTNAGLDWVAYVDADMLFFGDPDIALKDAGAADFLLTPHRFAPEFSQFLPSAGPFNAGYVAFRASGVGKAALARWRDLCVESVSPIATNGTYADQKYLERLTVEFPAGAGNAHLGLNVGPWNVGQYRVTGSGGQVLLNDTPLLLYHFQSFRVFARDWLDLYFGEWKLPKDVRDLIYAPYLDALARAYAVLQRVAPVDGLGMAPLPAKVRNWLSYAKRIVRGRANLRHYPLFK
ncbi:MAG TPA: hypothetical protein VFC38_07225 [Stellaceae bacterium]|nr:hypothetical protein [Stellaceae bacterium]